MKRKKEEIKLNRRLPCSKPDTPIFVRDSTVDDSESGFQPFTISSQEVVPNNMGECRENPSTNITGRFSLWAIQETGDYRKTKWNGRNSFLRQVPQTLGLITASEQARDFL
jgi:hypothetical protein